MKFFCQDHKNALVIFEGVTICPLCAAEREKKDSEEAFDKLEKEWYALEKRLEIEIGEDEVESIIVNAGQANEEQPAQ